VHSPLGFVDLGAELRTVIVHGYELDEDLLDEKDAGCRNGGEECFLELVHPVHN
jgi:hypothetical protein